MRVVAVHQPNFFPWLGFFAKLAAADVFVLLDDAQLPKGGGTWLNRVRLLLSGASRWQTAPMARPKGETLRVDEVRFADARWRRKLATAVRANYARAAHFAEVFPLLEELLELPEERVAHFNEHAIRRLAALLGLETEIVRASSWELESQATQRLIELVQRNEGTCYLSGDGSSGYLVEEDFARAGLELAYQGFSHPRYEQGPGEFQAGLSILDPLFHVGPAATARLLRTDA